MMTESRIAVRYPDCDPMGIVHHAVYPIWYEIARMDFFAALGYSYTDMSREGINPPMVDLHLRYFSAVRYPGQVTVRTVCALCQGKKLKLRYGVFQEGDPRPVAAAESFHIWTGPDMKSLDMREKPEVYKKLQAALPSPAVLLLAGGRSRRMGTDKAKLSLEGMTLLQRGVEFWQKALPEAKIYLSAGQPGHFEPGDIPQGVTPIYDILPDRGPMGGLHAAFHQTGEELFWVSAVDMPALSAQGVRLLEEKRRGWEDACVFQKDGRPEPLFGVYQKSCLPEMDRLMEQGNPKMTALLSECKATLVPLPEEGWVKNVNTPEDL